MWWPKISSQIQNFIQNCPTCLQHQARTSQRTDIVLKLPEYRWLKLESDLFKLKGVHYLLVVEYFSLKGVHYLLVVDYFSRFIDISKMSSTTSVSIIFVLKSTFSRYGILSVSVSDNGLQYASKEFEHFSYSYNFQHITSSPHYPKGNAL